MNIARANAYQALDGLVAKQAASLVGTKPRRYRAVQPQALLTVISEAQARKLDRLEQQLREEPAQGVDPVVRLDGIRAIRETATRGIVRAVQEVLCVAPAEELRALAPAFRARSAAGRPTAVWSLGPGDDSGLSLTGEISATAAQQHFPTAVVLLVADGALAAVLGATASGYWSADPFLCGVVRTAISALAD
jgi:hypothetical protein